MEKKLSVNNLVVSFRTPAGKVQAVRDISFDLNKGETLAIVGESGSGKSVTSKAILGILAGNSIIEGGSIIYDGMDLLKIGEDDFYRIRGDKIAMIFQDPLSSLNPIMRVGKQLTEAMLLKGKAHQKANYYYAWHFVPFLVMASTCSCFNQFMNSVYVVNKKSQRSMVTMMAGAVSNCIMNYFFIKWWGPVGATYASFLGLGLVFTLRAIDAHGMIGMRVHPGRVLVNAAALVFEAFVLLAETPLYGLWTGLITALIILYNFSGVWGMARILLPKLLGRRGKALVAVVDGWMTKK